MEIAVFGAVNIDLRGAAEQPFRAGDSIPGRVSASIGGVGWNIARGAASLGADTAFYSVLGADEYTPRIRQSAAAFGVSIDGCELCDGPNGRYLYITDEHGDTVAAVNDMAMVGRFDTAAARRFMAASAEARVLVTEANLPAEALRAIAEGAGGRPLVVDCVSAAKCAKIKEILPHIHTLKANRAEAEELTGGSSPAECAWLLCEAGVKRAVISLGAEGLVCADGERVLRLPAEPVNVVNTNGAGDCLTAALAVGPLRGFTAEQTARLGVRAAALAAQSPEAAVPDLAARLGLF